MLEEKTKYGYVGSLIEGLESFPAQYWRNRLTLFEGPDAMALSLACLFNRREETTAAQQAHIAIAIKPHMPADLRYSGLVP